MTLKPRKYIEQNSGDMERVSPEEYVRRIENAIRKLVETQKEAKTLEETGKWDKWCLKHARFSGILLFLSNNIRDDEVLWSLLPYDIAYDEMISAMRLAAEYDGGPGGGGDWSVWKENTLSAPPTYEPWPTEEFIKMREERIRNCS